MGKILKKLLVMLIVMMSASSCKKEDAQLPESSLPPCGVNKETVKKLNGLKGQIWFNDVVQSYAVYVGKDGTYDTQDVGVACNLPEEFQQEGLEVVFSGEYKAFDKQPDALLPGQTYYNLNLSKIELKP